MVSNVNRLAAFGTILLITLSGSSHAFVSRSNSLSFKHIISTNDGIAMSTDIDKTTQKYGIEAGLFQSLRENDGGTTAKELLTKYGVAYLATSIPLALLSFTICYALVDSGVDVAGVLSNIGIDANLGGTSEKVGTAAIAYAAHKASSPIRFPPTVLLTPVVAKLIGKDPVEEFPTEEGE